MNEDIESALAFAESESRGVSWGASLGKLLAAAYREALTDRDQALAACAEKDKALADLLINCRAWGFEGYPVVVQSEKALSSEAGQTFLDRLERAEKATDYWINETANAEARVRDLEAQLKDKQDGVAYMCLRHEYDGICPRCVDDLKTAEAKIKSLTAEIERKDMALRRYSGEQFDERDGFMDTRPLYRWSLKAGCGWTYYDVKGDEKPWDHAEAALKPQEAGECCDGQDPEHPSCFKGNDPIGKLKASAEEFYCCKDQDNPCHPTRDYCSIGKYRRDNP